MIYCRNNSDGERPLKLWTGDLCEISEILRKLTMLRLFAQLITSIDLLAFHKINCK